VTFPHNQAQYKGFSHVIKSLILGPKIDYNLASVFNLKKECPMFPAKDVMTKDVITVHPDTHIMEAIELLIKHSATSLPVTDSDGNLVGIFSEKDALTLLQASSESEAVLNVHDFMTKDVVSFDENDSLIKICQCMIENPFRRIPITSGGKKLAGVISRRSIMRKILELKHYTMDGDKQNLLGEDA